jgi:hypothetical protein
MPFAAGLAGTTYLFRHEITGQKFDAVSLSEAMNDIAETSTYLSSNRLFYDSC